jgi:hypothetical protein
MSFSLPPIVKAAERLMLECWFKTFADTLESP